MCKVLMYLAPYFVKKATYDLYEENIFSQIA